MADDTTLHPDDTPDDLPHTDNGRVDIPRLYASLDGRVWADEFCKVNPGIDVGVMTGWFANAIETTKQHIAASNREAIKRRAEAFNQYYFSRPEFTPVRTPITYSPERLVP